MGRREEMQVATAGRAVAHPAAAVLQYAAKQYEAPHGPFRHGKYEWTALLRQAARLRAAQGGGVQL